MGRISKSLRIPESLHDEIERELQRRAVGSWTEGVLQLLEEAVRASRAPGIAFTDRAMGRQPVVTGTGLDVWEIIATWRQMDEDYAALQEHYDWLEETQLRAALNYFRLYPDAIEERLALEARWTAERVREELPFTRPDVRRSGG